MATKNLLKNLREKNLHEVGTELVSDTVKVLKHEVEENWRVSMRQMLGLEEKAKNNADNAQKMEGVMREGEEINFVKKETQERKAEGDPDIRYTETILRGETIRVQAENSEIKQKLSEIHAELRKIVEKSKELEIAFKEVATETMQRTVKPGKYHLNFVEWMLSTVQSARVRIESSASWVAALSGKKSKKDYWSAAKSHGTSFTLSGERVVAQQTG